jgi:FHS family L-fucose permease-like MFS transporter
LGGILILSAAVLTTAEMNLLSATELAAYRAQEAASVQMPYIALAGALLALALFFAFAKLPKIVHKDADDIPGDMASNKSSALSHTHLVLGALGIFLYVGAEVSIGSVLINFIAEDNIAGLREADAAHYVSYYWGGAMIGRFIGFALMRYVSPGKMLAFNAICSIILVLTAVFTDGALAMWAIIAVGLCNSIMFPTIFSMALHNLGKYTGQGSGVLCMAIVGGALVPVAQGFLADIFSLQLSFLLPAACYLYIMFFGIKYAGLYKTPAQSEPAPL